MTGLPTTRLKDANSQTSLQFICKFRLPPSALLTDYFCSLILDFLDGGIASSSRVDGLGKDIGEYLRSKEVDIPVKSLSRGRI